MNRKKFITEYLSLFGVVDILFRNVTLESVLGTAIFDKTDPDEQQDFVYNLPEDRTPSINVIKLIRLLKMDALLEIDCIKISRSNLKVKYEQTYNIKLPKDQFDQILDELESIRIKRVNEGEEGDSFFIHE